MPVDKAWGLTTFVSRICSLPALSFPHRLWTVLWLNLGLKVCFGVLHCVQAAGDSPSSHLANVQVGRAKNDTSCGSKGGCDRRASAYHPPQIVHPTTGRSASGGERWTRIMSG